MQIKPLNDRVAIEPTEQSEKTQGGIFLPDAAKEKPQTGKVIAVSGGMFQNGIRVPLSVAIGDTVLFSKYAGTELKINDKAVIIVRESDVLAIIENK